MLYSNSDSFTENEKGVLYYEQALKQEWDLFLAKHKIPAASIFFNKTPFATPQDTRHFSSPKGSGFLVIRRVEEPQRAADAAASQPTPITVASAKGGRAVRTLCPSLSLRCYGRQAETNESPFTSQIALHKLRIHRMQIKLFRFSVAPNSQNSRFIKPADSSKREPRLARYMYDCLRLVAKAVLPSEHVPVILPIPDLDWAIEIKKVLPRYVISSIQPSSAGCLAGARIASAQASADSLSSFFYRFVSLLPYLVDSDGKDAKLALAGRGKSKWE
ncbi:unnamed protein product [Sphenostylis stenocarpa]|uniref:Uncharacterized protein n=1 Tax=Sphenostylis stenocarpa TaxID=92480 RepID=A0AA86S7Z3_9FABA|nr:unnamed protein product [Sphenostylis stenocarpa]